MKRRAFGVTVIELMIAAAIVAVLLVIAAPSFREFIVDSRLTGETNEFLTLVNLSRSEAVKRNARVTMCKSTTGNTCATSGTWDQGWISFVDGTGVGSVDVGDTILRVHGALGGGETLTGDTAVASYISFIPDGRSLLENGTAQAGQIDLCANTGSTAGRRVTIALGRAQASKITC